jgi:hypothetical protein
MQELSLQEADQAGTRVGRTLSEGMKKKVANAANLINEAERGDPIAKIRLHEVLSTSDFPLLVGHALDAKLIAAYQSAPSSYRKYVHIGDPLKDFRSVDRLKATRGAGILTETGEHGNLVYDAVSESKFSYAPKVYGGARAITWQMLVNDDLGSVKRAPDDLAWQAINTEEWFASALYVANSTLFATSGGGRPTDGNLISLPLSVDNLTAALAQYSKFKEDSGVPMLNRPKYLVHPPALRMAVRAILNSALIMAKGDTNAIVPTSNVLQNILEPIENPWIPYLDPTNGDTSWYIFADLADGWACEMAFLTGYDTPQLFMKMGDRVRLGGGAMDGSFDNGGTAYGAQHVMGGSHTNAVGGWRFALRSTGAGA